MQRLARLDLLRVLATLVVYLHHFGLIFYISAVAGVTKYQHGSWERIIYATPIGIFANGSFAVHIFLVLSGFVLALPFYQALERRPSAFSYVRRYFRLTIPIFTSVVLAYFVLYFGLIQAVPLGQATNSIPVLTELWQRAPQLGEALLRGVGKIYFLEDVDYNPVLWMMKYVMFGSFMLYLLLRLPSLRARRLALVLCSIVFFPTNYLGIFLGAALADAYTNLAKPNHALQILASYKWLLLVFAVLLGSFPMYGFELPPLYQLMYVSGVKYNSLSSFYHALGATLLLIWFLLSSKLEAISQHRIVHFFSSVSFYIYLIHLLVFAAMGSTVFMAVRPHLSYNLSAVLAFVLATAVIIPLAWIGYRFIEKPLQIKLRSQAN